ncbi:MAG: DUF2520 domain-containing protein [Tannerella sp.]|jgi:predicted short-subunit dehydrogenase-like oxidoreductase (DUF2520 family)|nr:DUF2520 domain-containing protein [Tannerella sp.]
MKKKVVFIGAGNVATHLAMAMKDAGYDILQVYSRTTDSAQTPANALRCEFTDRIEHIVADADLYVFALKDDAIADVIASTPPPSNKSLWVHTSGSVPLSVFEGYAERYGVIYPLQTFSKQRQVEFGEIPLLIEGSSREVDGELMEIAGSLSRSVSRMSSGERQYLHLAAVFANNFVNSMYDVASHILEEQGIDPQLLRPLIDETARKFFDLYPHSAQTGPAIRNDRKVIDRHLALIDDPAIQEVYSLITSIIQNKQS